MRLTFQKTARLCLLAGAIALPMVPLSGQAQQPGPTTPGQPGQPGQPPAGQLTTEQFIANPDQLLKKFPNGGAELISQTRELALANQANLPQILEVLSRATPAQGTAIGTGLGQAALASVKNNQAYATAIQQAIVDKGGGWAAGAANNAGGAGSDQPKIGSTVTTVDQVQGQTEKGTQTITTGSAVYAEEVVRTGTSGKAQLLFADRTNLTIAPMTEIHLDKYVYDPSAGEHGNVVVVATEGSFRFITGILPHEDYQIKTPFATMGIRGTEFIVVIGSNGLQIQVISGVVIVTTISGQVITMTAGEVLSVSSTGQATGPTQDSQPLVNFADLGPPITNTSYADALDAFTAVTGGVSTGATGAGGGGGGGGGVGGVGAAGGGGGGGGSITPNLTTVVVTTPTNPFQLNLTGSSSTPSSTTTTTTIQSVSPH
jgi:FecR protein